MQWFCFGGKGGGGLGSQQKRLHEMLNIKFVSMEACSVFMEYKTRTIMAVCWDLSSYRRYKLILDIGYWLVGLGVCSCWS